MKKAISSDMVLIGVFLLVFAIGIASIMSILKISSSQGAASTLQQAIMESDLALQGLKQSFEKTALFFGMMKTAKDLGEHGGVGSGTVSVAQTLAPKMQVDAATNVPYLAVVNCAGGKCETRKRMPFLFYDDVNRKIGSAKETITIVSAKKYSQNLEDVKNKEYNLYAAFQVFMQKPGTVDLAVCQKTNCELTQVTKSDVVSVKIDQGVVANKADDITVTIAGNKDDVAVLRQVAVSIYDSDVVKAPDRLLAESVNAYREKLAAIKPAGIILNPFEAVFLPARTGIYGALDANQGFAGGIVWAPDKISAGTADASLSSFGIAEEDAKIRYWRMYAFADYFVDNLDASGFVGSRMMRRLNDFRDYYEDKKTECGWYNCVKDPTPSYSKEDFSNAFNNELNNMITELNNKYKDEGFVWKASMSESFTDNNKEHKPNPYVKKESGSCCIPLPFGGCGAWWQTCTVRYSHEYILKNIKLLVEITDEKYKTFDTATNTWVNPTFKFFIEIYADDNYCSGYYCDTQQGGATLPKVPEITIPNLVEPTCAKTAGQTCETECTGGKIGVLSEVCEAGKVCCKPSMLAPPAPVAPSDCVPTDPDIIRGCPSGKTPCGIAEGCIAPPLKLCCMPQH